jgi:hypothetical protein
MRLVESFVNQRVQLSGRVQVPTKRFLDDKPRPTRAGVQSCRREALDRAREGPGRQCQIEDPVAGQSHGTLDLLDAGRQRSVLFGAAGGSRLVEEMGVAPIQYLVRAVAGLRKGLAGPGPIPGVVQLPRARDGEHSMRTVQLPFAGQLEQGGEQLAGGQVARATQNDQKVWFNRRAGHQPSSRLMACPPNWFRSAASNRSA